MNHTLWRLATVMAAIVCISQLARYQHAQRSAPATTHPLPATKDSIMDNLLYERLHKSFYHRKTALDDFTVKGLVIVEAVDRNITADSLIHANTKFTEGELRAFIAANNLDRGIPHPVRYGVLLSVYAPAGRALVEGEFQKRKLEKFAKGLLQKNNLEVTVVHGDVPHPAARAPSTDIQ